MSIDFPTVLVFITGILTGVVAALKCIAPRTENTMDDKVLEVAEGVLEVLPKSAGPVTPKS